MIKYFVTLLSAFILSGCMYQITSAGDIKAATEFCQTRGGINNITVNFAGAERVTCQDEVGEFLHRGNR